MAGVDGPGLRRLGTQAGPIAWLYPGRLRRQRMTQTDDLLGNNARYAGDFRKGDLAAPPARRVAVLACMDARLDPARILGLEEGDAHVIRNAGGVVTDDAVRSLAVSQHLLGTKEVMLIHHTRCGMLGLSDEEFAARLEREAGERPPWRARGFADLEQSVRDSIGRLERSPFLPHRDRIRGFVYDVESGMLREVSDQRS